MTEPISVVLIDDHGLCRRGLAELLEHRAGIRVVGATGEPEAALPDEPPPGLAMPHPDVLGPAAERYGIEVVGPPHRAGSSG